MKVTVPIQPDIIRWAIKRAGENVEDFIERNPNVELWLSNEKSPTLKQLENFSHKVHVPLGYLFLPSPPMEQLPMPFFRTGSGKAKPPGLNIFDTVLLIQQRQQWLTEYLITNSFAPLPFVGKFNANTKVETVVSDIRRTLKLSEEWASVFQTWEKALDHLASKIEDAGIIVTFNSIVENNTHRAIPVEECRGFILVNEWAPFMFINSADAKGAQLFTLVHELAHVWLGASAGFDNKRLLPADDPIEVLCDKVAAEFLVPSAVFNKLWEITPEISALSRKFKVSQIVIARRALDLGKITKAGFFSFYNRYIEEMNRKKENQSSGGDFYNTQKKRLSLRFTSYVNQAVRNNQLLYRDAYKITGLKGNTYDQFINKHLN